MSEKFNSPDKPLSPWAIEPGSELDKYDELLREGKIKLETIRDDLRNFARQEDFSYEIEKTERALVLGVDQEYFSVLLLHMKPLLREVNETLREEGRHFSVRLRVQGINQLIIALEPV